MKNKFIYIAILAAGLISCEPEFENVVDANYTAGEADFSTYVAVGNSLTAGYMDGSVSRIGQSYSFPNLLAGQFSVVGGGAFTQPSYEEDVNNLGGISGIPGFNTRLIINASAGGPQPIAGTSTVTLTPQATAYNNMGVPGAKSFHLLAPGYGNPAGLALGLANPYYVRHATSSMATVLGDAVSKNPTFFTNWIGANDILSYATSGGTKSDESPADDHNATGNTNPATYGSSDITNSVVFAGVYSTIIDQLTANGAKGVVCTIPNVTSIPYFTTVPFNPIPDATVSANPQAALVVQLHGFLNLATGGRVNALNLTDGVSNAVLINDERPNSIYPNLSAQISAAASGSGNPLLVANAAALGAIYGKARSATAADLLVLPSSSIIGQTTAALPAPFNINGLTAPLANKWVLSATEQVKVATATTAYNASIRAIAASKNLAVADMNAILNQLVSGLRIEDGTIYTANYFSSATAGTVLFSLDGVHPNARGYAVLTNQIINVINSHYKSNIPLVYAAGFPGATILPTN